MFCNPEGNHKNEHDSLQHNPALFSKTKENGQFKGQQSWYGNPPKNTVGSFLAFVNKGWPEGVSRMKESLKELNIDGVTSVKRKARWQSEGDDLNMEKVWSGELDTAWRGMHRARRPAHGRIITIWCATNARGDLTQAQLFWRGATACILAEALEKAGYSVEIVGFSIAAGVWTSGVTHSEDGLLHFHTVTLKRHDEDLDMSRMAALTAHIATHRTITFASRLASKNALTIGLSCYGYLPPTMDEADIVIDKVWTKEASQRFLSKMEEKYGGKP
jgi:hypothetical protein